MIDSIKSEVESITSKVVSAAQLGGAQHALRVYKEEIDAMNGRHNAFAALLIGSIMAVIIGAVMLYIGLFVTVTVGTAIPAVADANYNSTLSTVKGNVNTAFTLLGIILIVGGAGGIIAVLTGFLGGRR